MTPKHCPNCKGRWIRFLDRRGIHVWWICTDCDYTWSTKEKDK